MEQIPRLGQLIENGERRRDAIHIAVAPVTAAVVLTPGQRVGLLQPDNPELVGPCERTIGVVDPFLSGAVQPGQRFWLFLFPGTITGLRHMWTHPAFANMAPAIEEKLAINDRRNGFLTALAGNEDNTKLRLDYAYWLDKQGEHEEADRQRKWTAAKQWLVAFCQEHNPSGDDGRTVIPYGKLIELAREAVANPDEDGELWLGLGGNEWMREALTEHVRDFWKNWSIVTGVPVPPDAESKSWFSCSC